jgi:hypothetical protein
MDWSDGIAMMQKRNTRKLLSAATILRSREDIRQHAQPRLREAQTAIKKKRAAGHSYTLRFRPAGTRFAQRKADCCSCHI